MTDTRKVQIEAGLDTRPVKEGFQEIVQAAEKSASGIAQASAKAGKAVDGIGNGADVSAKKIENAERSIIASIQRRTAAVQAAGQSESKYYEELARQRGVNTDTLRPYLQQLDAAKTKQDAANASLGKMGVSAGQTAAALRNVPAQFTDILTSLQGGQAPLTVMLQQGGQLKDMFGGVGNAAKALGGYVVGLINPFTLAAAAVTAIGAAAFQGAAELQSLNKSLILTGGVAGVSGDGLAGMAAGIAAVNSEITKSRAVESLNLMVEAGVRGETQLGRYAKAAAEFERAGGSAASKVADNFAALGKDPLQAALKLNDAMGFLSSSTADAIRSLEAQGRTVDAARLAQDAYATALETRTPLLVENIGFLESAWRGVASAMAKVWDLAKDIGRDNSLQQQVDKIGGAIDTYQRVASAGGLLGQFGAGKVDSLRQEQEELRRKVAVQAFDAKFAAQQSQKEKERIAFMGQADKYLTSEQRQQREILAVRNLVTRQIITQEEAEKRIAAIRAQGASKARTPRSKEGDPFAADREAAKGWADAVGDFTRLAQEAEGKSLGLTRAQQRLVEFLQSPAYQNASEPMRELALQQAYVAISAEQTAEALKKEQAAIAAAVDAMAGRAEKQQDAAAAVRDQVVAQKQATAAYGLSDAALLELEIARLSDAAAERERQAVIADGIDLSGVLGQSYRDEAQALRDLAAAKKDDASVRQQKDQYRDLWAGVENFAESAFMDIAMNGESAFERIGESLKREVIQLLYEMTVKRWILNISGVGTGSTSSGYDFLSNAYSAYSMASTGGAGTAGASGSGAALGSWAGGSMSGANALGSVYANATGTGIDGLLAANGAYGTAGETYVVAAETYAGAAETYAGAAETYAAAAETGGAASGVSGLGATGWGAIIVAAIVAGNNLYKAGYDRNALTSGAIPQNRFGQYSTTSGQGVGQSSVYDSSFERYKRSMLEAIGVNEQWSDILSGTTRMAALFGRKLAGYGFDVDVAGSNIGVTGYESYKGGLFRSDKTRERAIDPRDAQMVRELVQETRAAALETARNMGLSTDAIEAWNGELKINFKNVKDAEDAQARYNKALGKMYEDMIREAQKATFDADMQRQVEGVRDSARTMAAALGLSTAEIDAYVGSLGISMDQMDGSKQAAELMAKATEDLYFQMLQGTTGFDMTREKFDEFIEGIVASAESFGISAKGISDILVQGMTGRLGQAEVGDQLASMIVGGIYNAIAANYANTIAQAFTTQIITPIFTAIAAGVPISQAISKAAIANVVKTAQNAAAALKLIFDNAEFQSAIKEMGNGFKGVAAAVTSTAGSVRGLGSAASSAASEARRARDQIKQEWKSIADSIIDEVKRIRGVVSEEQGNSYSFYAARFAIATGQARANNKDAAAELPELSQATIEAARNSVTTLAELQLIEAQIAQSLQDTAALLGKRFKFKLPSFDVGTDYVPEDMLAMVHKGERITPAPFNPANSPESGLADAVRRLSAEVQQLKGVMADVESNTGDTSRLLKQVTFGEESLRTVAA